MKFEIIESSKWEDNNRIILVEWFNSDGSIFQYSTHLQNKKDNDFDITSGHYFFKKELAIKDFFQRFILNNIS